MIVMHVRQRTVASFDGRRGALKGFDPVGRPRGPRRQDLGGQPLGDGVPLKRGAHLFQGLLPLGLASAATCARHLRVPIHHRQEARVHPLRPSGRQDTWFHILSHPLPPKVHQGSEGRSLPADFVHGVVLCRQLMAPREGFDRLNFGV